MATCGRPGHRTVARVLACLQITRFVKRVDRRAGILADKLRQVTETIVLIVRGQISGIGDGRQIVVGIVSELRDSVCGIGHLLQPIQRVVLIGGVATQRLGNAGLIAVVIVAKTRRDRRRVGRIDFFPELVQCIERPSMRSPERIRWIVNILRSVIAHGIESVHQAIACTVGQNNRNTERRIPFARHYFEVWRTRNFSKRLSRITNHCR